MEKSIVKRKIQRYNSTLPFPDFPRCQNSSFPTGGGPNDSSPVFIRKGQRFGTANMIPNANLYL
jgi:hypothetical protein